MDGKWTDIPEGQNDPPQAIEKSSVLGAKKRPPNPSRFSFEKVNEVTWKLTNGGDHQRPGLSWLLGGYRTLKAIAWVVQVEGKWLARCKDQTSNPMPLNEAKAAAMAMAKGATGDYVVTNPISHLNEIAARPLDAA